MSRTVPTRRISLEASFEDVPRRFARDDDLIGSHLTAAFSAVFPDGEDFFVRTVRHYRDRITDPELRRQVAGFIGQESTHGREHRAFNDHLARLGYPTRRIERIVRTTLRAHERVLSAEANLAVTVALEHFTATIAEFVLTDEEFRAAAGHPAVVDLLVWHALEESEHKAVAYDVFQHVCGDERIRVRAMRRVTVTFIASVLFRTVLSLLRDPAAYNPARLGRSIFALRHSPYLSGQVVARIRAYFAPGFHPHGVESDALLETWREELFGPAGKLAASLR